MCVCVCMCVYVCVCVCVRDSPAGLCGCVFFGIIVRVDRLTEEKDIHLLIAQNPAHTRIRFSVGTLWRGVTPKEL